MNNEYLDKLEKIVEMDTDQSTNILETLPLAHNRIVRIFDEAANAITLEKHRRLMTEGSKQWLRYEKLLTDLEYYRFESELDAYGIKEEE